MKHLLAVKMAALLELAGAMSCVLARGIIQLIASNDNLDVIAGRMKDILNEKLDKIEEESPGEEKDITRSPDYVRIQDIILSCICAVDVLIVASVFFVLKHFNLPGDMFLIVMYAIASFGTVYFMKHNKTALMIVDNLVNAASVLGHDITKDLEKNDEQNKTPKSEDQKQEFKDS